MFYAYPSFPVDITENIEGFAENLNSSEFIHVKTWRSLETTGNSIFENIIAAIDDCDVFGCDLSVLNPNVLFELGYAVAKSKRVWISLNSSYSDSKSKYKSFEQLTDIGYRSYINIGTLVNGFYSDRPDLSNSNLQTLVDSVEDVTPQNIINLFYLRAAISTNSSNELSSAIDVSQASVIVDDPVELPPDRLRSYIYNIKSSDCVVAHMLSMSHEDNEKHNNKTAFLAGMAYGFGKSLLLLAHAPYQVPFDFNKIIRVHESKIECIGFFNKWFTDVLSQTETRKKQKDLVSSKRKKRKDLTRLSVGQMLAENEKEQVLEYFFETSAFRNLSSGLQSIFVGRKGTGKTANLFALAAETRLDKRNFVCIIKPIGYELDGMVRMLQQNIHKSEKGFLLQSFWKFLIYTELAKTYMSDIQMNVYHTMSADEAELKNYILLNSDVFDESFSIRLDKTISRLDKIGNGEDAENTRRKISEGLHSSVISDLKRILSNIFSKKNKVSVLFDDLDKSWIPGQDIKELSDVIFGLLSSANSITEDFKSKKNNQQSTNLTLGVFLRSDIFSFIKSTAREIDKLPIVKISWNDPETIMNVIDRRFEKCFDDEIPAESIWEKYIVKNVNGIDVKKFILSNIILRPRDAIFFVKTAIDYAIDRGHEKVLEADILEAYGDYSKWVCGVLEIEDDPVKNKMGEILNEFFYSGTIQTRSEVLERILRCVPVGEEIDYLNTLCDLGFFRIEISKDKFVLTEDEEDRQRKIKIAQINAEAHGERYKINSPFIPWLEIQPS